MNAVLLGIIQGLTEFLPVSSSGHLLLFQQVLHLRGDELLFDLVVHVATLLPVLWVYRGDLATMVTSPWREEGPWLERPGVRLAALVVLATLPTAVIGLLLKDTFEALFGRPQVLVVTFSVTGVLLFLSARVRQGSTEVAEMRWWQALVLGLAQGLAITPGISRSGTTIAVGLFLGLSREHAARMSFLMAIPAISGAFVLQARQAEATDVIVSELLLGGLAALVSGYLALVVLLRLVRRGGFARFSWYLWALAAVCAALVATGRL